MPTLNAILGLMLLLAAAIIGAVALYTNLHNTKGDKERTFVRRNCLMALGTVVLTFALIYYLPNPWRYVVLLIYFVHLPVAIYRASMKRQLIRRAEELAAEHHSPMTG